MPALRPTRVRTVAAVLVAVVLLALGYAAGRSHATPKAPADASAEVGFARDMSAHHAQAVTLAMLAYARTTMSAVRELADDIVLSQQREIGVMTGWLQQWRQAGSSTRPAMAWMDHGAGTVDMPGMATRREVAQLAVARAAEVDLLFCRLMLRHHVGGMHMISEVLRRTDRHDVTTLALRMRSDQQREIEQLQRILHTLGASG